MGHYINFGGSGGGGRLPSDRYSSLFISQDFVEQGSMVPANPSALWGVLYSSTAPALIAGDANHAGAVSFTVSALAAYAGLYMDKVGVSPINPASYWDSTFIFLVSNYNVDVVAGLMAQSFHSIQDGVYIEKLSTDTNMFLVTKDSFGGGTTRTDLGFAPVAGTWYRARFYRVDASTVALDIDGVNVATATTDIPIFGLNLSAGIHGVGAGARNFYVDYVDLYISGLSR